MAIFFLINTVLVGTNKLLPGQRVDDAAQDATAITAAGGLLWPDDSGGANIVAVAATNAVNAHKNGANEDTLAAIMSAAVEKVQKANDAAQPAGGVTLTDAGGYFTGSPKTAEAALQQLAAGNAGTGKGILEASLAVGFADLNALGAAMTGHIDFAAALPANARFLGALVKVNTLFQNAGDTATLDSDLGDGTTPDLYIGDADLHTTGEKFAGDAGGKQLQDASAKTPRASFTCSVNLSTLTAGAAVYKLFYIVLA